MHNPDFFSQRFLLGLSAFLCLCSLGAQCPDLNGESANGQTSSLALCADEALRLGVDGSLSSNLPDGGLVRWFYSTNPSFDPSTGQGTALGDAAIQVFDTIPTRSCGTLQAGDIAFLSFQSDDPDEMAFVPLVNIAAGTRIGFTDNGWRATNSFRLGEGVMYWTAPATGVPAGTIVYITVTAQQGGSGSINTAYNATVGTAEPSIDHPNFQLATAGDQILAFCGLFDPDGQGMSPLAAINFNTVNWGTDATSAQTSALFPGLTNGQNAISVGNQDNGRFLCTGGTVSGDAATIAATINTPANWITSATPLTPAVSPCNFAISESPIAFVDNLDTSFSQAFCGQTLYIRGWVQPLIGPCTTNPSALSQVFELEILCPDITLNSTGCAGTIAQLGATGASDYLWSTGETTAAIDIALQGGSTIQYSLSATMPTGCVVVVEDSLLNNPLPVATITGPSSLCQGQTLFLETTAGAASYLWSTGQTTRTINEPLSASGSYQVTINDANGCQGSSSYSVTALPLPSATLAGPSDACFGETININVTGAANLNYLWPDASTTANQSFLAQSDTSLSVEVSDANACVRILSYNLVVRPELNLNVIGPNQVCAGQDATLITTGTAGLSYNWSTGEQTSSIVVNPNAATTYSITASDASGCTISSSWLVDVTGSIQPNISQSGCTDNPSLSAFGGPNNFNYLWSTGQTTASIPALPNQNYSLTITEQSSGCVGTTTYTTPNHVPLLVNLLGIDDEQTRIGGEIRVDANGGTSPYFYQWNTGETSSTLSGLVAAPYGLTVTDANGCSISESYTVEYQIPMSTEEFDEQEQLNWTLHPNPAEEQLFWLCNLPQNQRLSYSLYDAQGRLLRQELNIEMHRGEQRLQIQLDGLASGFYYFSVVNERGQRETKSFIRR